jgi:hypothetical protein
MRIAILFSSCLLWGSVSSFQTSAAPRILSRERIISKAISRRECAARIALLSLGLGGMQTPVQALEDLDMANDDPGPSAEERSRIAAKLALQKEAAKGKAINRKLSVAEAMAAEKEKQRGLEGMSKKAKSEDLCELLGRGC